MTPQTKVKKRAVLDIDRSGIPNTCGKSEGEPFETSSLVDAILLLALHTRRDGKKCFA